MADTLVLLQLEHRTIERLLAIVESQCVRLADTGHADLRVLSLVLDYFREWADACHHPKEDLVFERLRARDAGSAAGLAALLNDHEALERLTVEVAELVSQRARDGIHPPDALIDGLQRLAIDYRRHLEMEELHFFPTVAAKLDRRDWDLIDFQMFDQKDPLYDEGTDSRFRELRQLIRDAN